jgi:hypothetical protein
MAHVRAQARLRRVQSAECLGRRAGISLQSRVVGARRVVYRPDSGRAVLSRSSEYMAITCPGVQKPHWVPLHAAIRSCTGWKPFFELPIPSVVVTVPSKRNHTEKLTKCEVVL